MENMITELKDDLLVMPSEISARLGWKAEARLLIEKQNGAVAVRQQKLTADKITDLACIYLIKYVGDATAVKTPLWQDGKWRVEVVLSYRPETIGFLTFSSDGQLIESESDSRAKLKGIAT